MGVACVIYHSTGDAASLDLLMIGALRISPEWRDTAWIGYTLHDLKCADRDTPRAYRTNRVAVIMAYDQWGARQGNGIEPGKYSEARSWTLYAPDGNGGFDVHETSLSELTEPCAITRMYDRVQDACAACQDRDGMCAATVLGAHVVPCATDILSMHDDAVRTTRYNNPDQYLLLRSGHTFPRRLLTYATAFPDLSKRGELVAAQERAEAAAATRHRNTTLCGGTIACRAKRSSGWSYHEGECARYRAVSCTRITDAHAARELQVLDGIQRPMSVSEAWHARILDLWNGYTDDPTPPSRSEMQYRGRYESGTWVLYKVRLTRNNEVATESHATYEQWVAALQGVCPDAYDELVRFSSHTAASHLQWVARDANHLIYAAHAPTYYNPKPNPTSSRHLHVDEMGRAGRTYGHPAYSVGRDHTGRRERDDMSEFDMRHGRVETAQLRVGALTLPECTSDTDL